MAAAIAAGPGTGRAQPCGGGPPEPVVEALIREVAGAAVSGESRRVDPASCERALLEASPALDAPAPEIFVRWTDEKIDPVDRKSVVGGKSVLYGG